MSEPHSLVVTGDPSDQLAQVAHSFPGPAMRVGVDGERLVVNAAAAELMAGDDAWWPDALDWLARSRVSPGARSFPVRTVNGPAVVEWAATPLRDGSVLLLGRDCSLERQLRLTLTESRRRYKDLVEVSSDFAWETGADGRFVFVSPRGALGFEAMDLIGRDPRELVIPEWEDLPLPFDTRTSIDQAELWLKTARGEQACLVASALPLTGRNGEWLGARGVCRDITEQVARTQELTRVRNRERLLAHIAHTLRDRLDASESLEEAAEETTRALGADGCRVHRWDETAQKMIPVAAFGGNEADLVDEGLDAAMARMVRTPVPVAEELSRARLLAARTEYRQTLNGAIVVWRDREADRWDEEDVRLMAGIADHIAPVHAHIAYQQRLRRLSERDGLTGLLNRRTFYERLEEALLRPDIGSSALLYADLDNFKPVNDLHGHQRGDEVLRAVSELLTGGTRPGDILGRVGGDEFVLWLSRADESVASAVAERLLRGVAALRDLSADDARPLGLSVGIAVREGGGGERAQELADRADHAMYAAKTSGKDKYAVAPPRPTGDGNSTK